VLLEPGKEHVGNDRRKVRGDGFEYKGELPVRLVRGTYS